MKIPKPDKERSKRLTPKKIRPIVPVSPQLLQLTLESFAPHIEAAGNFDRAVRLGLISTFGRTDMTSIRAIVPLSRGGTLSHPDADRDWDKLVKHITTTQNIDMAELRKACDELE